MTTPRVALLGCGAWGRQVAQTLHGLGALAAIHDPDPAARAWAADSLPAVPWADSPAAAWAAADAVAVAAPSPRHAALAEAALAAGRDVFVEKPMALSAGDAERLCQRAAARGLILMVGHLLDYHPAIAAAEAVLAAGRLGTLRGIFCRRLGYGRVRPGEDVLWSLAPHDVALALRLAGAPVAGVTAWGSQCLGGPRRDAATVRLRFTTGLSAQLEVSWLAPTRARCLSLVGSRAILSFDDVAGTLSVAPLPRAEAPGPALCEAVPYDAARPLARELSAFVDAVATRVPPRADGAAGAATVAVLAAADEAATTGAEIMLPAQPRRPAATRPAKRAALP